MLGGKSVVGVLPALALRWGAVSVVTTTGSEASSKLGANRTTHQLSGRIDLLPGKESLEEVLVPNFVIKHIGEDRADGNEHMQSTGLKLRIS